MAESAAQVEYTFTRTRVRVLQKMVQERKLRLAIWAHDCGIQKDDLAALNKDKDTSLIDALELLFSEIFKEQKCVFKGFCDLRNMALEAVKARPQVSLDAIDEAQKNIEGGCDRLNRHLHELAKLQNAIKMSLAVKGRGSEADMYNWIRNRSQATETDAISTVSTGNASYKSGDEQCPKCRNWFPSYAFDLHQDDCTATERIQSEGNGDAVDKSSNEDISLPKDATNVTTVAKDGPSQTKQASQTHVSATKEGHKGAFLASTPASANKSSLQEWKEKQHPSNKNLSSSISGSLRVHPLTSIRRVQGWSPPYSVTQMLIVRVARRHLAK
ncbi:hypothetical protein PFICI_04092 [Pestalotiopsis fici W106-1]|uniref:Uncharacterized protein n=1 Tax=Pestalotiopsis fici (strain W106-1 / CGMCC3.15140) TaxID=1229662 RepID=W3XKS4_PESFW|nr:uncharacterized protein PFICI_04092 [Pestalotiopsis fici W106-1]ETS86067.1 hypothetical protein PFICI_04092 [Pestalotiopsis fici W106-1]